MGLPAALLGILQGAGLAGSALAQDRARQEDRTLKQRTIAAQEEANRISAEKGTVSPQALTTMYETLGLPVPSNLAEIGRIPEGVATSAMTQAAKQAEVNRGLAQGRQVADDMTNQYGRVVPLPGDEQPGPIKPVVDDPYLRTILSTVRTTGLTDKTAPQVEAYGKFRAERDLEAERYERGQQRLRDMGILPPKAGGAPGAAKSGVGQTYNWLPKVTDKGVEVHATAPTDPADLVAIEKYGTLFRGLDEAQRADVAKIVQERKVAVSAAQGAAGVTARSAAERQQPLIQALPQGVHIVDRTTGEEVNPLSGTIENLQKEPGRYARIDAKAFDQLRSIKESEVLMSQFVDVARQFTSQPGANLLQAVEFWGKTHLGIPNPGVALQALDGIVLRLAGAMQGSRAQLSDKDTAAVRGMLPKSTDTIPSAAQKLQVVASILSAMREAHLGGSSVKFRTLIDSLGTQAPAGNWTPK